MIGEVVLEHGPEEVVEHRDGEKEVFSSDGLIAPLPESVGLSHKKEGSGGEDHDHGLNGPEEGGASYD